MTIYGLYAQNGNRAGFWIQHRTWKNMCAQVQSIGGKETGALPGSAPCHDNAQVLVRCFDVRSGRPMDAAESLDNPRDRNYAVIAQPAWAHRVLARYGRQEPDAVNR